MRTVPLLALAALSATALAGDASADKPADERDLDAQTMLGEAVTYENLTLVPVLTKAKVDDDREYLVLDEAFEKKQLKIKEKDDEQVNELTLTNKSDKALFVMAGEVILGGKQDRIIGKDTLIQAKQTVVVPVFCVEHGRWTEEKGSREFRSGKTLAHTKLRMKANYEEQGAVWDEVDKKNKARKVDNSTKTYRKVAEDKSVSKAIESYDKNIGAALAKVKDAERMIGFVVAVNGKVVGMETFGSPKLFQKLKPKMLRSYYVEAVDLPVDAEAAKTPVDAKAIKEFNEKGKEAERRTVIERKGHKAKTKQLETEDVLGSEVEDEAPLPAQPELYKSKNAK
jgi:hypothetical protein